LLFEEFTKIAHKATYLERGTNGANSEEMRSTIAGR